MSLCDIELTVIVKMADPLIMFFFNLYPFYLMGMAGLPCEPWWTCNAGTEVYTVLCYQLLLLKLQGNGWAARLTLA